VNGVSFNGYWELGRRFSMSPVETAKAFNAPLLRNDDSNASIKNLVEELGHLKVKYGAVEAARNDSPFKQHEYDSISSALDSAPRMRLEITNPISVRTPRPGEQFGGM
jgi:hypothetical protein